jgi:hypothetical protein
VFYAPDTSATAVLVAEMAAKELVCSGVMRQVAVSGSFYIDTAGILAAGLTATCTTNPLACLSYLRSRPGGLPPTAALVTSDLKKLCQPACLATRACFSPVLSEFLTGFPTEAAAVAAAAAVAPPEPTSGGGVAALLVLPPGDLLAGGDDITYTLRTNASDVPNARMVGSRWARESFDAWVVAPSTSWKSYWFFANVQRAVDMALVSLKTQRTPQAAALLRLGGVSDVLLSSAVKQYPYMAYATNLGASFAALFFGLVFVFAFLTTVVLILKSLVMEKELRIREGMLMMGLHGRTYWLSWFVTHYSTLTVVATLMALVGIYPVRALQASAHGTQSDTRSPHARAVQEQQRLHHVAVLHDVVRLSHLLLLLTGGGLQHQQDRSRCRQPALHPHLGAGGGCHLRRRRARQFFVDGGLHLPRLRHLPVGPGCRHLGECRAGRALEQPVHQPD